MERNKIIFESQTPSVLGVVYPIRGLLDASRAHLPLPYSPKRKKKPHDINFPNICWFDGASQNNGALCGAGGMIMTRGNTIYRWTLNYGMGTNTREELLGVWARLTLAHRLGFDRGFKDSGRLV
jgi:hypothetical protein